MLDPVNALRKSEKVEPKLTNTAPSQNNLIVHTKIAHLEVVRERVSRHPFRGFFSLFPFELFEVKVRDEVGVGVFFELLDLVLSIRLNDYTSHDDDFAHERMAS